MINSMYLDDKSLNIDIKNHILKIYVQVDRCNKGLDDKLELKYLEKYVYDLLPLLRCSTVLNEITEEKEVEIKEYFLNMLSNKNYK